VQQPLFKPHGGKRSDAGRPAKGPRPSERHKTRPVLRASEPVHVVARVLPGVGSLRKRAMYLAIREATITAAKRDDFRIVHLSIQRTHLHLIVETQHRTALAKGMQGFLIAAAKYIKRALFERTGERKPGAVFTDRYHACPLATPRQVRNCIAYVLNNWRHHDEHLHKPARAWKLDPFSSAIHFSGWKGLDESPTMYPRRSTYDPLVVWQPKTWLLRVSWQRHGCIDEYAVPGERTRAKGKPPDPALAE
jgi:REP element-mobilizing transposase RayT